MQDSGSVFKDFRGNTKEGFTVNPVKKIEGMAFSSGKADVIHDFCSGM
ncbi:hypothetical protein [Sediminibacter sp. Hel_I_10]|nr:hypothetical protein [Sediminibacter sp. Hel_I_10]